MKVLLCWLVSTLALYVVSVGSYSFIVMGNWFNPADWTWHYRVVFMCISFGLLLSLADYDSKVGL